MLGLTLLSLLLSLPAQGQLAPEQDAGNAQAAPVAAGDVDQLLDAIEKADQGLERFDAEVQYDRRFALQQAQQIRRGKLWYQTYQEPMIVPDKGVKSGDGALPRCVGFEIKRRRFGVHFTSLQNDDVQRDIQQSYIFDGEWFVESDAQSKRYTKRQIAKPGQAVDPLKLGEGPFPLPIGQKKDDIKARYDASIAPVGETLENEPNLKNDVAQGCTQLKLVPRSGQDAGGLREIRIWYRPDPPPGDGRMLPRLARTVNEQGDESFVWLVNLRVNPADFDSTKVSLTPPPAEQGWDIQEELLRGDAAAEAPGEPGR